jgi:hypothetical protein
MYRVFCIILEYWQMPVARLIEKKDID